MKKRSKRYRGLLKQTQLVGLVVTAFRALLWFVQLFIDYILDYRDDLFNERRSWIRYATISCSQNKIISSFGFKRNYLISRALHKRSMYLMRSMIWFYLNLFIVFDNYLPSCFCLLLLVGSIVSAPWLYHILKAGVHAKFIPANQSWA